VKLSNTFFDKFEMLLSIDYHKEISNANAQEIHNALTKVIIEEMNGVWERSEQTHNQTKRAYYLSAEFLMGRAIYNNLFNLDILDEIKQYFTDKGVDFNLLEEVEDAALGNGGLGRLAACFLDSAATQNYPLNGYGIRYRYGLFAQEFIDGLQVEHPDEWQKYGDPWGVRKEEEHCIVHFSDQTIKAIPYDMPIIGYGTNNINTLRLFQSEALVDFHFATFNDQDYYLAVKEKFEAENICNVLYPNDTTPKGKELRLKQQYFFSSASLQDILVKYKKENRSILDLGKYVSIQLNDTHPVWAIPELIRLLTKNEKLKFEQAFEIAKEVFSYTNHTIMSEALEKWSIKVVKKLLPEIYKITEKINMMLIDDLIAKSYHIDDINRIRIIDEHQIHMAHLAIYSSHKTNGVAEIHTNILKNTELRDWAVLFPERFENVTNGVTQRRWLGVSNPNLTSFITELLGTSKWLKDLPRLKELERFADDQSVLRRFIDIKHENKERLANHIEQKEGIKLDPSFIFDVQIKRMHEYKRQLLNAFSILDIYYGIKEGKIKDFSPTVFLFGGKAAPGYYTAKGVIKYINELSKLINNDPEVNRLLKVLFVHNYNVSYAEKMFSATDVSEQISTAGKEASGTGNMKFMLNGTVTLGTYDGATVEIVAAAGVENNYIFGATVEELSHKQHHYNPWDYYHGSDRVRRIVDTLINGTFNDGGTGVFKVIHNALMHGESWRRSDNYFILYDFAAYQETKLRLNRDYKGTYAFAKKAWINMCNVGNFSSDRSIENYASKIWGINKVQID